MKRFLFACIVVSFAAPRTASADLPAWCGKNDFTDVNSSDINQLKRPEPDYVVRAIAKVRCSTAVEASNVHDQVDKARAAWGKKLGMEDADWADAVDYIDNRDGNYPKVELSTKVIAQFTPLDQFRAIHEGLQQGGVEADAVYVADMLQGQLTEVGRLAFIEWCFKERLEHGEAFRFAVCQSDIDAWDPAKFAVQLRGDTVHTGANKMQLRLRALELADTLKDYKAARDKMFAADEEYKKVWDVAAKARAEWAKGVGANTKLLDLVLTMESATFAGSRKQFAGCEDKTDAELKAQISANIPAKAFKGMGDVRDDPFAGFAHQAGPVLANTPAVNLAAIAYVQCNRTTATSDWLMSSLQQTWGVRGPRSAAFGALLNEKFTYDDVNARAPNTPEMRSRPYSRSGGSPHSAGGVVDSVKNDKEVLTVALQKTKIKTTRCIKSHTTNRVIRINSDGRLDYETICDKEGPYELDTTWADFKINPANAPLLKKGVLFSAYHGDKFSDVIAIWPSKTAALPSLVLGAKLK